MPDRPVTIDASWIAGGLRAWRPGGIPPAVQSWAPESSVSEARWIAIEFGTPAPFFYLVLYPLAVILCALRTAVGHAVADRLAQMFEPAPRPREFDGQNRQADRNHYEGWAGRYDHDDAQQHNGCAHSGDRDTSRGLVGQV